MKYNLWIEIDSITTAFKEAHGCALRLMLLGPIRIIFTILAVVVTELILSTPFGSAEWIMIVSRSAITLYSILVFGFTAIIWKDRKDKTYSINQ